jgi:hypothetical protein
MRTNPETQQLWIGRNRGVLQVAWGLIIVLMLFALAAGCNDSSSSSSKTGVFNDSPVSGLDYETPSLSGTTDSEGKFRYRNGQTVTFSVGGPDYRLCRGKSRDFTCGYR